ncbi:MAG: helix-turn-helix transcriptional regulator [Saprospiraceae bacterium]|nr:helix-turn-helix transcriptional regulator [Saprospiraceae bacterium]MBK9631887.1 helix-turn-helix transcriptional regulator [Saprospiraceae bacterium]
MNKSNQSRGYTSPLIDQLLSEISPLQMEKTKIKMLIAARIDDILTERKLAKIKFAELVDKNPSEITKWLSGTQNFTIDILTEIAFTLKIDIVELFTNPLSFNTSNTVSNDQNSITEANIKNNIVKYNFRQKNSDWSTLDCDTLNQNTYKYR